MLSESGFAGFEDLQVKYSQNKDLQDFLINRKNTIQYKYNKSCKSQSIIKILYNPKYNQNPANPKIL
jgi:hypothetical protein